jgi:hypothetical protein
MAPAPLRGPDCGRINEARNDYLGRLSHQRLLWPPTPPALPALPSAIRVVPASGSAAPDHRACRNSASRCACQRLSVRHGVPRACVPGPSWGIDRQGRAGTVAGYTMGQTPGSPGNTSSHGQKLWFPLRLIGELQHCDADAATHSTPQPLSGLCTPCQHPPFPPHAQVES